MLGELAVKRILKPVTYVLATLYFLVDAAFMAFAKPISDWLARHVVLRRLRAWIRSLRPYPSLALFSVPVIMLEPVKPVAAYLAATDLEAPRRSVTAGTSIAWCCLPCWKPPKADLWPPLRCDTAGEIRPCRHCGSSFGSR